MKKGIKVTQTKSKIVKLLYNVFPCLKQSVLFLIKPLIPQLASLKASLHLSKTSYLEHINQ
jgi:hypothetical protein